MTTDLANRNSDQFTKEDRCDRCTAAAQVKAVLPEGGELLFCAHHAREHKPRLIAAGAILSG